MYEPGISNGKYGNYLRLTAFEHRIRIFGENELLNLLFHGALDDLVDVDALQMDVLGSDLTDLDNLIRLDNGDLGVLGHGFVEVVHSHAESAVTKLVSLVDLDESVITEDRLFQNVLLAVEFPGFLWFRHFCDGTILVVAYGELTSLHYVRM